MLRAPQAVRLVAGASRARRTTQPAQPQHKPGPAHASRAVLNLRASSSQRKRNCTACAARGRVRALPGQLPWLRRAFLCSAAGKDSEQATPAKEEDEDEDDAFLDELWGNDEGDEGEEEKGTRALAEEGEEEDDEDEMFFEDDDGEEEAQQAPKGGAQAMGFTEEENDDEDEEYEYEDEGFDEDEDDELDFERDEEALIALEHDLSMEPKTLRQLLSAAGVPYSSVEGDLDVMITNISCDSRCIHEGALFICIQGDTTDGHFFAPRAAEEGAVAVICDEDADLALQVGDDCDCILRVSDTHEVISAIAAAFYEKPTKNMTMVGITGTNGKTTTAHIVREIFQEAGIDCGMLGTIGHNVGDRVIDAANTTPDAINVQRMCSQMQAAGQRACVMETSSHALVQGRVRACDFDVAVFTNLTHDHLDYHGTMENYRDAKLKLFESLRDPHRQRAVVNLDDPYAKDFIAAASSRVPVFTFSMENPSADVFVSVYEVTLFETVVRVRTPVGTVDIASLLVGKFNINNILAAICVGLAVDIPLLTIRRGIEALQRVPGRFELVDGGQPFGIIVDYAHTPDALERLLQAVRELNPQRLITVFGCGGDRDRDKRPVMGEIAMRYSDFVVITTDNPRFEDPQQPIDDIRVGVERELAAKLERGEEGDFIEILDRLHGIRVGVIMGDDRDAIVIAGKVRQKSIN